MPGAARKVEDYRNQDSESHAADNNLPVHLKGGTVDAVLYRITMAITVGGTLFSLYSLVYAAMPKRKA
ncbi:cytochrome c oxidase subunit 7A1, mitochondrial-like [Rhinoraja longicauda]